MYSWMLNVTIDAPNITEQKCILVLSFVVWDIHILLRLNLSLNSMNLLKTGIISNTPQANAISG